MLRLLVVTFAVLTLLVSACDGASGGGDAGVPDGPYEATAPNTCTSIAGNTCQASPCGANTVNIQDYKCGLTSDYCCGPVGEGGIDASNDVNVFVDAARFEAAVVEAAVVEEAGRDAGSDATTTGDGAP